ncbi:type II toxin-antitoxin system RelE/ParE family toxin [Devosia sp. D6-9]|nr:type II toxin-antitoxin system RelE/ParE family toxin [Devosia sp. D6-9]
MRKARYLKSAERNLLEIYQYIAAESGDFDLALNTAMDLRGQCRRLGELPGTLGRSRSELAPELRSFPYRSYMIFFRYLPDAVEIVAVLHGHRDVIAYFDDDAGP